jgi:two-component system, response regulator
MNSKYILLVEDNPDDVKLTQRAFKKWNIANEMVVAEDGAKALEHLFGDRTASNPGEPLSQLALILLDVNLPKVNGLEVLQRLRADPHLRRTPVVMLTSSEEEQDILRSYDLGANSYIRKPVDFQQFAEAARLLGMYWLLLNEVEPNGHLRHG